MSGLSPVPRQIVDNVAQYVRSELADAERYENRQPLDESGVWSLHRLAEQAYAQGWIDGHNAAEAESRTPHAGP